MRAAESVSFARLLKHHRVLAGLSQEALAEAAAISPHAISALERGGNTRPQLGTVQRLAAALGLDPAGRVSLLAAARPGSTDPAAAPPVSAAPAWGDALPLPPTPYLSNA